MNNFTYIQNYEEIQFVKFINTCLYLLLIFIFFVNTTHTTKKIIKITFNKE